MIILRRKRLFIVALCFILSVSVFLLQTSKKEEVKQVVSLPVSQKVIVLDAGHGVPDEGGNLLHL